MRYHDITRYLALLEPFCSYVESTVKLNAVRHGYIITPYFNVGINQFYQHYECRRHGTHPKTADYTGVHW